MSSRHSFPRGRALQALATLTLSACASISLSAQAVPDTLPPVLLIHGIWSSQATWDVLAPQLTSAGFNRVFRTSTNTAQALHDQKDVVKNYASAVGIQNESPILVAHSMGGLIARQLSTELPSDAIITVGSPHNGHTTLNEPGGNANLWYMSGAIGGAAVDAVWNLSGHCGQQRDGVDAPCYTVGEFLSYTTTVLALIHTVNTLVISAASIDDMSTESSFILALNATDHVNSEQASSRISIIAKLYPEEQDYSMFRMKFNPYIAENLGSYLPWFSAMVQADGWDILWETIGNTEDPWYWERIWGAGGVILAGSEIQELPNRYNELIGGWPNDGFMPVATQYYPLATSYDLVGVAHVEETESFFLRDRVIEVGTAYRRN